MLEAGKVIEFLASCVGRQRVPQPLKKSGLADSQKTTEELHRLHDCVREKDHETHACERHFFP